MPDFVSDIDRVKTNPPNCSKHVDELYCKSAKCQHTRPIMSMKPACEIPECMNKADYVLEYECGSEPNDTAFICKEHANINSKHWNMRVKSVMEL